MALFKEVAKLWGKEKWLVNEKEYCCKILMLNKGSSGSLHFHRMKKETFLMIRGKVRLEYDGGIIDLKVCVPITIQPGKRHRFTGIKDSKILEVSTHHDDNDVVRLEESKT